MKQFDGFAKSGVSRENRKNDRHFPVVQDSDFYVANYIFLPLESLTVWALQGGTILPACAALQAPHPLEASWESSFFLTPESSPIANQSFPALRERS